MVLDGTRLPLPSKSLGFVMIHQVIEHLKPEDQQHALNEITRVLIPKGIAFVSTPNADSRPKGSRPYSPDHKHELSQAEFLTLLHNRFESVQVYGQRFLKRGMAGRVYQLARNSPLNDVYFNCLPRSWRLRIRDRLSANQQADVIRPFGDRDVPRSFVAVCHQPKK